MNNMKLKKYIAGSLMALLALTTACTHEELVPNAGGEPSVGQLPEGAVQFKIDGINNGAVETRATGGTVLASAQENRVDDMTILIFGSEKENAKMDELVFHSYWTSEKRADFICDTEKKTFALKGMGKYYTATVVVPAELKSTYFVFVTNEPRQFDARSLFTNQPNLAGTMTELKDLYKKGDDHLHVGYAFEGKTIGEALLMLSSSEAIDGVGVPASYGYTVPATLPCDQPIFEMENDYFGFIPGQRETLGMIGLSHTPVTSDGQSMAVVLYRNVARLDVSIDGGISLSELKLTNISALSNAMKGANDQNGFPFNGTSLPDDVQSTFSLMRTNDAGALYVPTRSYCYPSVGGSVVSLVGEQADGTPFTIPFVDKDSKQPLAIENNHRYTIKIRRTSDNHIDANIIVEAWNVGDEIDVDMNGGDDITPAPALHDASDYQYAAWENMGKVTCMVSDNYTLNSTNPATYPWLRFDLRQMSSLGLRMYYGDTEVNFPGPFFDPTMKVHNTVESADGTMVRHELMVTFPTVSTQWLKLQNNFDPTLNYVVKVETGNMEATGMNSKTPALIAFAETNVANNGTALINFPSGGFDGPYAQPVADWTIYRGQSGNAAAVNVANYALPSAEQIQCVSPDINWGRFDDYNGANVVKTNVSNDIVVYYSGSPLDRNVVKVVIDRTQTGTDLGTAGQYVNAEATLWHYDARGYLKINSVNMAIPGTDAGRLTSYTALMDLFNNKQNVSAGYTRFFPASADPETAYLGEGGTALVFSSNEVKFVENYAGRGYTRPVLANGTMKIPARVPVTIADRVLPNQRPVFEVGDYTVTTGQNGAYEVASWADAVANAPQGYVMPKQADINNMAGVTIAPNGMGVKVTNAEFLAAFPDTGENGVYGTWYWLADENGNNAYCVVALGDEYAIYEHAKTAAIGIRYVIQPVRPAPEVNGRPAQAVGGYWIAPAAPEGEEANKMGSWNTFADGCPAGWTMPSKAIVAAVGGIDFNTEVYPGSGTYTVTKPEFYDSFPHGKLIWLSDEAADPSMAYYLTIDRGADQVRLSTQPKTQTYATARYVKLQD